MFVVDKTTEADSPAAGAVVAPIGAPVRTSEDCPSPAAAGKRGPVAARRAQPQRGEQREANLHGISVSAKLMGVVGDAAAGIFVSQLIYWSRRTADLAKNDGWLQKTAEELQLETGMSWKVQKRARQILVSSGWLEERRLTMPARLEFRLNLAALGTALAERSEMQLAEPLTWEHLAQRDSPLDRLLGRSWLFHGVLTQRMSLTAAVLASRLESRPQLKGAAPAQQLHWVRLQREEWRDETGLSRDQWQTARKALKELKVVFERGHNFPRRVDLAADPKPMAALLVECSRQAKKAAEAAAAALYEREREKQAGGNGRSVAQPSGQSPVSPDPAFNDRPVLPVMIPRPRLYYSEVQITNNNHPFAHARLSTPLPQTWLWGSNSWGLEKKTGQEGEASAAGSASPAAPSSLANTAVAAINPMAELHWPKALKQSPHDLGAAMAHLKGLDHAVQQSILDEIVFTEHHAGRQVKNHVGLVRSLSNLARQGKFVAEGAHKVAQLRADRLAYEAAQRAAAPPLPTQTEFVKAAEDSEGRKKLKETLARLKRRVG